MPRHNMTPQQSRLYNSWRSMRKRCNSPSCDRYEDYGGRGIKVCAQWDSFDQFCKDMGERPLGRTLGRIDNDGWYTPGNCRWETYAEQNRNHKRNVHFTFGGKTLCLVDWEKIIDAPYPGILSKLIQRHGPEAARKLIAERIAP